MTNEQVAERFVRGVPAKAGNLSTDGKWLRSYLTHIGKMVRTPNGPMVLLWGKEHSQTTQRHVSAAASAARSRGLRMYTTDLSSLQIRAQFPEFTFEEFRKCMTQEALVALEKAKRARLQRIRVGRTQDLLYVMKTIKEFSSRANLEPLSERGMFCPEDFDDYAALKFQYEAGRV